MNIRVREVLRMHRMIYRALSAVNEIIKHATPEQEEVKQRAIKEKARILKFIKENF